jgi:hypothetical protein
LAANGSGKTGTRCPLSGSYLKFTERCKLDR